MVYKMAMGHLLAAILLTAGLSGGAVVATSDITKKVNQLNETLKTGISDSAINCGVQVLSNHNISADEALTQIINGKNDALMNELQACNPGVTNAQRWAATGYPDWLIQQIQETK